VQVEHVYDVVSYGTYTWLVGQSIGYTENDSLSYQEKDQMQNDKIAEIWHSNNNIQWETISEAIDKTTHVDPNPSQDLLFKGFGGSNYRFIFIYNNKLYVELSNYFKGTDNYLPKKDGTNEPISTSIDRSTHEVDNNDEWVHITGRSHVYDLINKTWNHLEIDLLPINPNSNPNFTEETHGLRYFALDASVYKGTGWNPQKFKDKIVYLNCLTTRQTPPVRTAGIDEEFSVAMQNYGLLYEFYINKDQEIVNVVRGGTEGKLSESIWDFTIDEKEETLYVLEGDGDIYYTSDLNNWHFFAKAPDGSMSIEILNNILYIGATNARLFSKSLIKGDFNQDGELNLEDVIGILKLLSN